MHLYLKISLKKYPCGFSKASVLRAFAAETAVPALAKLAQRQVYFSF